jgi:quercetin dioxygenase-like cupin family protein
MKSSMIAVLLAALPLGAAAQDAVKVDPSHYKVLLDNAAVRVLKISYGVGEKSPMHSHPDAMLVPLGSAKARFTMPDGKTQDMDVAAETAAYTPAMTHSPANVGTTKIDALLVEFKAKAAGTASLPTARPGMTQTVLAEGPRATAWRTTAAPTFHEAAGTTHEYDQVVIALGDGDVKVAVEGQPARTKWQRGDFLFIGRGAKHESQNMGGKPLDFVIVGIK